MRVKKVIGLFYSSGVCLRKVGLSPDVGTFMSRSNQKERQCTQAYGLSVRFARTRIL
jgi:hypothetical protein